MHVGPLPADMMTVTSCQIGAGQDAWYVERRRALAACFRIEGLLLAVTLQAATLLGRDFQQPICITPAC